MKTILTTAGFLLLLAAFVISISTSHTFAAGDPVPTVSSPAPVAGAGDPVPPCPTPDGSNCTIPTRPLLLVHG